MCKIGSTTPAHTCCISTTRPVFQPDVTYDDSGDPHPPCPQVISLVKALPQLLNVLLFLTFVFVMFTVLGVQLWGGQTYFRCRFTEFPIQLSPDFADDYFTNMSHALKNPEDNASLAFLHGVRNDRSLYPWCSENATAQTPLPIRSIEWTFSTSPWREARQCVWPVVQNDTRVCDDTQDLDSRPCPSYHTCGSDYDTFGHRRFIE